MRGVERADEVDAAVRRRNQPVRARAAITSRSTPGEQLRRCDQSVLAGGETMTSVSGRVSATSSTVIATP